jgi:signal transduction histidine kinase
VSASMATATGGIPRLEREGKVLAGVCAGIARHFGVSVRFVRIAFIVLTLAGGVGVALYGLAYVSMTSASAEPEHADATVILSEAGASWREGLGAGAIAAAAAVAAGADAPVALPIAAGAATAMVLWRSGLGLSHRGRVGAGLMVVGAVLVSSALPQLGDLQSFAFAVIVVLAGSVLLFGPWWLRMAQALTAERTARIRAQERAEVAAHLHDSVLQTLALIQRRSDDPAEVAQLARRQERDLRAWLNQDATAAADTLHGALVRTAAEVEAQHGIEIEVVCVGDRGLDHDTTALVAAAREAMVNAAKFAGAGRIDVYAEASEERTEVFVRDRGAGFDPEAVPADRRGVRESIVGRMARHGGRAEVRSAPGQGTEVELVLG